MKNKGWIAVVIVLIVAIVLNVGVSFLPPRFESLDLSGNGNLKISASVEQFLAGLDEEIVLYGIRAGGEDLRFERFLERFAALGEKLSLKWVELDDSDALLKPLGVTAAQLEGFQYCVLAKSPYRSEMIDYQSLFYYQVNNATLNSMGITQLSASDYQGYAEYFASSDQYSDYLLALINESELCFHGEAILAQMIDYTAAESILVVK